MSYKCGKQLLEFVRAVIGSVRLLAQPLAKFQLHILITYGVTALQSCKNRTIDLYSEYWGNRLQVPTKTVVTYKPIEVRSYNFRYCTHHEQGNGVLGKFLLYSPFFTAFKGKIHEEKSIVYDCFDVM